MIKGGISFCSSQSLKDKIIVKYLHKLLLYHVKFYQVEFISYDNKLCLALVLFY